MTNTIWMGLIRREDPAVQADAKQWAREKHMPHAQAHAQAIDVYPNHAGPRLKAVLDAQARGSKAGKPLDLRASARGPISPLGGLVGDGFGPGRPTVAARWRRP